MYHSYTAQPKLEIVNISDTYSSEMNGNRWDLLRRMTFNNPPYDETRKYYDEHQTFQLDDQDPSTKVVIGVYNVDYENKKPGGIIMLQRLPDGKDAIYWEITSPLFAGDGASPVQLVKDINNDGLKEIVTAWGFNGISEYDHFFYWILTVDPHTKTYKVLNPITGKDGKPIPDFNFEHTNLSWMDINKFEVYLTGTADVREVVRDINNDGISEIIAGYLDSRRIYKWNATKKEYYLWKQTTEPVK